MLRRRDAFERWRCENSLPQEQEKPWLDDSGQMLRVARLAAGEVGTPPCSLVGVRQGKTLIATRRVSAICNWNGDGTQGA